MSYLLLDENRIISSHEMHIFIDKGFNKYKNIIGSLEYIKKYITDLSYSIQVDKGFKLLSETFFFISEKRIVNAHEAETIYNLAKYERKNHFIGTSEELKLYERNRSDLNDLHSELMYKLVSIKPMEIDKLSMMNIANFMNDKSVGNLSRVSKSSKNVSELELRNRSKTDKFLAARMGYDTILRTHEPLIVNRMYIAARVGNISYLQNMIKMIPYNDKNVYNKIIESASINGHYDIVILAMDLGGIFSITAFSNASKNNHIELIDMFAKPGEKFNVSRAAYNGHINIIKLLLNRGTIYRYCAITNAARNGHLDIIELILEDGINNIRINDVVQKASLGGHINVIKYLMSKDNKDNIDINDAMVSACTGGHISVVKYFISLGASSFNRGLYDAIMSGNKDLMLLLLNLGDISKSTYSFLYIAAFKGNMDMILTLIEHGEINYNSIAYGASMAKSESNTKVLIFSVNKGATNYNEILKNASNIGSMDMVNIVIERATMLDEALKEAINKHHYNIAMIIMKYGGNVRNVEWFVFDDKYPEITIMVLKKINRSLDRYLILAIDNGNICTVKLLLDYGAVVSIEAILSAKRNSYYEIVNLLEKQ
jgi:ankyrin repeat protein